MSENMEHAKALAAAVKLRQRAEALFEESTTTPDRIDRAGRMFRAALKKLDDAGGVDDDTLREKEHIFVLMQRRSAEQAKQQAEQHLMCR